LKREIAGKALYTCGAIIEISDKEMASYLELDMEKLQLDLMRDFLVVVVEDKETQLMIINTMTGKSLRIENADKKKVTKPLVQYIKENGLFDKLPNSNVSTWRMILKMTEIDRELGDYHDDSSVRLHNMINKFYVESYHLD